jgi:membrane-associated phospholipid phosphatase
LELGLHSKLQRGIERALFGGRSTKRSVFLAYATGNVVLMLLLFYLLLNTLGYDWTGQLYPLGSGFRLDSVFGGLDNAIPFVPQMVVFYVYLFYPFVILTMLYFAFVEYRRGYALGWSLVLINAISLAIYIAFPVSTYWWRRDYSFNRLAVDFWTSQVYAVWAGDTPFNCFPSLHASVSTICFYTWYRYSRVRQGLPTKAVAGAALLVAAGVILSTLFIKQHYIADEVAGIVLALGVGKVIFDRQWAHIVT